MSEVTHVKFDKKYIPEQELYDALADTLGQFADKISVVAAIGVLDLLKADTMRQVRG